METFRTTSLVSMSVHRVYINRSCSLFSLCFLLRPFLPASSWLWPRSHPRAPAFTSLKRFSTGSRRTRNRSLEKGFARSACAGLQRRQSQGIPCGIRGSQ